MPSKYWHPRRSEQGPSEVARAEKVLKGKRPPQWAAWLYLTKPENELLKPLPAGSLSVETVRVGSD